MSTDEILSIVLAEVERAENKHPDWPTNHVYQAAIVAEENGELMREAVKLAMMEHDADENNFKKEAIEVAAVAIRLLKNFQL